MNQRKRCPESSRVLGAILPWQPENSGTYTYSFTHLSDANYKRIKLDGPSISQVVHPLASAGFVFYSSTGTSNRRIINSCSGNTVDVEVDLRGVSLLQ